MDNYLNVMRARREQILERFYAALDRAGRPRDADDVAFACMRIQFLHDFNRFVILVLHRGDRPRYGEFGAVQQLGDDVHKRTT